MDEKLVLVAGGRGFVGSALVDALIARGNNCIVLSRESGGQHHGAAVMSYEQLDELPGAWAVINLAGANIGAKRWSDARKRELLNSRLDPTRRLSEWSQQCAQTPQVFLNASAIGFYGPGGEDRIDESGPAGADFGADLCQQWEQTVQPPESCRRLIVRIAVVLGAGGALAKMLPAFRLGAGGRLGDGRQWMSWIALPDLVNLFLSALDDPNWSGVVNAVAPQPVRNTEFTRRLGEALNRPTILPMPAAMLRLLLGEMSDLLLQSQRIESARLGALGFEFAYPRLDAALQLAVTSSRQA